MNLQGLFETRKSSVLGRRSRENLPPTDRRIALLFSLSIYLVPSQLTTDIQMSSSIPHLNVTEAAREADECKSINKLIGLN